MLEITMLPAQKGDAIWIRWGEENDPHLMIVDMGIGRTGKRIRRDIKALPPEKRKIDLLVVSHVDEDHIKGVLSCLDRDETIDGLEIKDVWFNGYQHLKGEVVAGAGPGNDDLEAMGPVQGEKFSTWLRKQKWNKAFGGGPVQRKPDQNPPKVTLHDDLEVSILGPTPARLEKFIPSWEKEVRKAFAEGNIDVVSPGLEGMGGDDPPELTSTVDLKYLADSSSKHDESYANGSSIVLLLAYKGKKILLAGDGFAKDICEAIQVFSPDVPLKLDAFKVPHHGSQKNVHKMLVEAVECPRWLISTNGARFHHPDAEALARIICYSRRQRPELLFNVPSKYNGWWNNDTWKEAFSYTTKYGTEEDGVTIRFDDQ
jgi:hypothetical protein